MIIFTPIKDIPDSLLEFKGIKQVIKYNLSSYYCDIPTLNFLIPSSENIPEEVLQDCTTCNFDVQYHDYIMNNTNAFIQFMSIMVPVFNNADVLLQILINQSEYRDILTESLLKLIQQRYGYNGYIVNDLQDFLYIEESDLSVPGLFIIDKDIEKWRALNPPLDAISDMQFNISGEDYY